VTVNLLQPSLGSKGMLTAPRMRISQFAFLHAFTSEPFRARSTGGAGVVGTLLNCWTGPQCRGTGPTRRI
jgi:hypothetical protein